jgi:hypothetical protein
VGCRLRCQRPGRAEAAAAPDVLAVRRFAGSTPTASTAPGRNCSPSRPCCDQLLRSSFRARGQPGKVQVRGRSRADCGRPADSVTARSWRGVVTPRQLPAVKWCVRFSGDLSAIARGGRRFRAVADDLVGIGAGVPAAPIPAMLGDLVVYVADIHADVDLAVKPGDGAGAGTICLERAHLPAVPVPALLRDWAL